MIFNLIIIGFLQIAAWLLGLLNFINFPGHIVAGLADAVDFMMIPFGVVSNYVGSAFLSAIFTMILVVFPVLYSWLILKWILQRTGVLK